MSVTGGFSAFEPPFLQHLVFFAAFFVFFVVEPAEVRASALINFQPRATNLVPGKGTNCIFVTAHYAAFNALTNPTQSTSPILYVNSKLHRILDQRSIISFEFIIQRKKGLLRLCMGVLRKTMKTPQPFYRLWLAFIFPCRAFSAPFLPMRFTPKKRGREMLRFYFFLRRITKAKMTSTTRTAIMVSSAVVKSGCSGSGSGSGSAGASLTVT